MSSGNITINLPLITSSLIGIEFKFILINNSLLHALIVLTSGNNTIIEYQGNTTVGVNNYSIDASFTNISFQVISLSNWYLNSPSIEIKNLKNIYQTIANTTNYLTTSVASLNYVTFFYLTSTLSNYSTNTNCLLYTSPSPRDRQKSRMPSSA